MKRNSLWMLALSLVLLVACRFAGIRSGQGPNHVVGSGDVMTEEIAISGVSLVHSQGPGDIDIIFGDEESLVVEAEDNILPLLSAEVRNGTLVLGTKPNSFFTTREGVHYTLTLTQLEGLTQSGSGAINIAGSDSETFDIESNGSGSITLEGFAGDRLDVELTGSGSIEPDGSATTVMIGLSGSGRLKAADLRADNVNVTLSGSGDATVWATKSLDATVSGSGSLEYYGDPARLETDVSGSGRIRDVGAKD